MKLLSRKYALIAIGVLLTCLITLALMWETGHSNVSQQTVHQQHISSSTSTPLSLHISSHTAPSPTPTHKPSPTPTHPASIPLALESPEIQFPGDAVINLKTAYGAKGDGVTDDTAAFQRAIKEKLGNTFYLPSGTYLINDRLEARDANGQWQGWLRIWGENRDTTIIKLKDNSPSFGDPQNPRAVLYPASGNYDDPNHPSEGYLKLGEGNMAFGNYIENLTIDTGNNRGAIGIDYIASNIAAVRKVTIRGQGTTGLSMTRAWPGPGLISQLCVQGFDYGIRVAQGQYGMTLEHLQLTGQRMAALRNEGNILAIRDFTSINTVPALQNSDPLGFITLVDSSFTGGSTMVSAIENMGEMMARTVATNGYRSALTHNDKVISGNTITEFTSRAPYTLFSNAATHSLNLPAQNTPEFYDNNLNNWANVLNYGAQKDDWADDTAAIQKALDSGKSTIYFPTGRYFVSNTLHIRGNVRKIVGLNSTLAPFWNAFIDAANPQPFFELDDGNTPNVIVVGINVGRLYSNGPTPAGLIGFEHRSSRPLVLQDIGCCGDYKWSYHSTPNAGPLFIENVSASRWQFDQPQQIWARQFNPEDQQVRVVNNGATLWILGFKTEQHGPVFLTQGGGQTELLGGAVYEAGAPTDVAFECDDSHMSLSFATMAYDDNNYKALIQEKRGGTTQQFLREQAQWRGYGKMVPLYVD